MCPEAWKVDFGRVAQVPQEHVYKKPYTRSHKMTQKQQQSSSVEIIICSRKKYLKKISESRKSDAKKQAELFLDYCDQTFLEQ